jgi:hypothetical protein
MYPVLPVAFNSSQASNVAKNSLRIASSNGNGTGNLSTYLSKRFSGSGNCKKWTFSTWYKPTANNVTGNQILHAGSNSNNNVSLTLSGYNGLFLTQTIGGVVTTVLATSSYFYDPTSWYHLVVNFDATNATPSNKLKFFINGEEITDFKVDNRNSITNTEYFVGSACIHHIGGNIYDPPATPSSNFGDYQITETTFVDGLQLDSSYFGGFNSILNTWIPKKYNGSFGVNGFYLNYSDTSLIGKDNSGLNNNFIGNNINLTEPLSSYLYDLSVDVPGNYGLDIGRGGEVKSNYSTFNYYNKHSTINVTKGALSAFSTNIAKSRSVVATMGVSYGKWYCEFEVMSGNTDKGITIGTVNHTFSAYEPSTAAPELYPGYIDGSYGYYGNDGKIYHKNASKTYGNTYTMGDIIGMAMDIDNLKLYFSKNGIWQNSGNPVLGTNPAATLSAISAAWFPAIGLFKTQSVVANFGQKPFAFAAPIGFKSFCTYNLVEPIIKVPNQYFRNINYTGSNSTVTYSTSTFSPDLIWIKNKNASTDHLIIDTTRGATSALAANKSDQQTFINNINFTTNGISLPTGDIRYNNDFQNYISWNFKKGILPGLDIVSYRGTGTKSENINHSLQAEPSVILIKSLSGDVPGIWSMWHKSTYALLKGQYWLALNSTNTAFNPGAPPGSIDGNPLGNSLPTSSYFNVGFNNNTSGYTLNVPNGIPPTSNWRPQGTNYLPAGIPTNFNNFIAYLFTDVDGFSRFNFYTGNGLSDGPYVWCGFQPALIIVKSAIGNIAGNWAMYDNVRGKKNANNFVLYSNLAAQQTEHSNLGIDILSNGFKIKGNNSDINAVQNVYIFLAFAELPAKYSLAK